MHTIREDVARIADEVITAIAGPDARPRADQVDAVCALLVDKRRTLVVQRTGWGKSAVYWIAASVVRRNGGGIVFVVSPLLALMRNQVESAKRAGLRAASINSSAIDDWGRIEGEILRDELDIVFVSPERLANPGFTERVMSVVGDKLGMLVIDEAHCISSWGHDFRPDYQRIAALLMRNPQTPVLCTTATANMRVTHDVASQLGEGTYVLRGQLARESLHLAVVEGLKPAEHFAWVSDALATLSGSGIIYTLTVDKVVKLTEFLRSQGHNVAAYYGAVPAEERLAIEDALLRNEVKAVVATSALGMGYDKPDLAFCIHVGCPGSPVDYYQQVGRAGRALDHAVVALVTDQRTDKRIWEWFATSNIPKPAETTAILDYLGANPGDVKLTDIATATTLTRPRTELLLKVMAVDGAVERTSEGWRATETGWTYDARKYAELVEARRVESARMAQYADATTCLETQLRVALDDDVTPGTRCGRCSVCRGELPNGLPITPSQAATVAAQRFLRGVDHPVENRKMWPKGLVVPGLEIRSTRMSADQQVREGRALAYGDDATWADALEAVRFDGPLSDEVASGIDELLARWQPEASAVVAIPSSRRPVLVGALSAHVAQRLGVPLLPALTCLPPADTSTRVGFAQRPDEMAGRLSVARAEGLNDAHVLLVDDSCYTRWTFAIAGALLRAAGAASVTPLALHQLASASDPEA